jgi:threonine dehydratase
MALEAVPDRSDVDRAAARIAPFVWHTPIIQSAWLSEQSHSDVWLKLEFVQPTGSFKARGAMNSLLLLKERQPAVKTVVTASAGNHGAALAWAGAALGLHARVHLPVTAPAAKRRSLLRLGAELVDAPDYDTAESQARRDAAETGALYISAYNHPDIIAGAATAVLEMLNDRPGLDTLIVPLGGGGLLAGAAVVARSRADDRVPILTVGAECEASPVFTTALAEGAITAVEVRPTLADGLAGNMEPGSRTFAIVRDLVDRVALVAEGSIEVAMKGLMQHERLIVEGASATAVGAVLQGGLDLAGRHVGIVLSGRNVDIDVLRRMI